MVSNHYAHTMKGLQLEDYIVITHSGGFSCIWKLYLRVPRMLFKHEADRPSGPTSHKGPGKNNVMKQICVTVILAFFTFY